MAQSPSAWTTRLGHQFLRITPDPDDIRQHAPIAVPFVTVVLVQAVSAWSIRGLTAVALAADQVTAEAADWLLLIMMVFSPVLTIVKALTLAALTWAILVLFSAKARFRPLLSIHMYGTLTLALSGIATAMVLRFRRSTDFAGTEDLLVPMGLDLIVDPGSSPGVLAAIAAYQRVPCAVGDRRQLVAPGRS